jgi:type VI secretion system secreted protein VgrG
VRRLTSVYERRDMQVRYGESLLTFAARLMESEGVHFHFEDDALVLADANASFMVAAPPLTYAGDRGSGALVRFASGQELVATSAVVRGFNFLTPNRIIEGRADGPRGPVEEVYVFSSAVTDALEARRQAVLRLEENAAEGQRAVGASLVPTPRAGRVITVVDMANSVMGGAHLVTAAHHVALRDSDGTCFRYANSFEAIPFTISFRPPRVTPVPNVGGTVSAVVTGPPGTTIYRDVNSRVKIQFRFDRESHADEKSSAWIRVGVPAGRTGELFVPRVGSEVLVAFIEGDPSQPVVIGSLNNPVDPPPVLPTR